MAVFTVETPDYTPRQQELLAEWLRLSQQGTYPFQGMLSPNASMTWEEGKWLSTELVNLMSLVMLGYNNA